MDDRSLDEGPSVDFGRATLQIAKENEVNQNQTQPSPNNNASSTTIPTSSSLPGLTPSANNIPSISFKRLDAQTFFSDRNDVVERAIEDCTRTLTKDVVDGEVVGCWLLTQISLWDTEKERLILLTKNAVYTIKYDFISLKTLEYSRVPLAEIDTLVNGELVYPPTSLVPGRNISGLQLMWNKGKPLPLEKKWNPFAKNIPWLTFASHPLFWHKGTETEKMKFDVEGLHAALVSLLGETCNIVSNSIVLENYVGLGALLHNRNSLGFFKIRGKVSF